MTSRLSAASFFLSQSLIILFGIEPYLYDPLRGLTAGRRFEILRALTASGPRR